MSKIKVCHVDELAPGDALRVDEHIPPIAVYNVDGEFLATADTCSHDDSSLADGYIDGAEVECSWHFAKFCLRTGKALTAPATTDIVTFTVVVEDEIVYVQTS